MRSELGEITSLGKNRWLVRVSAGYDKATGKRIRKSKTVRGTKKDARKAMNALLSQYGAPGSSVTLSDFVDNVYMPWHRKVYTRRDSTQKLEYTLSRVIEALGDYELSELTRPVLVRWCQTAPDWQSDKLRAVLNKAVEWEYVDRNHMPRREKSGTSPDKKRITAEQLADVLDAVRDTSIEPGVLLQACCGLRMAEALAVDWADIDFERGTVHVKKTWHYVKGDGWMEDTKNANSKGHVAIPASVLKRLKEIRTQGGVIRKGALMPTANGTSRMIPNTYRKVWKRVAQPVLGEDYIPPKNLRHTHGSILFDEGVSVDFISKRLRHSSTRITERHYVNPDSTADDTSAAVFDGVIGQ